MLSPLLLTAMLGVWPTPLTDAALRDRYGDLAALTAEIAQVKEGRFWARPMHSQITLRWTPSHIEWETTTPIKSLVTIEGDALAITDARGKSRTLTAGADPRLRALMALLRAFLSLDLAAIEREYVLDYQGRELIARLRPQAGVRFFSTLRFRFDDALELVSLDLESEAERTQLLFQKVVRSRRAGGAR